MEGPASVAESPVFVLQAAEELDSGSFLQVCAEQWAAVLEEIREPEVGDLAEGAVVHVEAVAG